MSYHITEGLKDLLFGYKNGYVYKKKENGVFVRDDKGNKQIKRINKEKYRKRITARLTNDYFSKDRLKIIKDYELEKDGFEQAIEDWEDWIKTKIDRRIIEEDKNTVDDYRPENKRYLEEDYSTYEKGIIYLITAYPASNKTGSLETIGEKPQLHIVPYNLLQEQTIERLSKNKITAHRTDDGKVKPSTELCGTDRLSISLRSTHLIDWRNSLGRDFLILDEFPITLQQTLWKELSAPDLTEEILHREIRETDVVLRLGGAITKYELKFWKQFKKPIHIIEYKYDVGEGRTIYRCETDKERKISQIAEYENGNTRQLIMLEEGRAGCKREAEYWKAWSEEYNKDITVEYISRHCLQDKARKQKLKDILKIIANPNEQYGHNFFLILSPCASVGYDIRNEFDITAISCRTTDKIFTDDLIVQSALRERDTKKIYTFIGKGGLKNGRQGEDFALDVTQLLSRKYKNQFTLDTDGNPTLKDSWQVERAKEIEIGDDRSRNSRYLGSYSKFVEMGFNVEETPYRHRKFIKLKKELKSWEDNVVSAQVPSFANVNILDEYQREKHLIAQTFKKAPSEVTREDIQLWDRGNYKDRKKRIKLLKKTEAELNYDLGANTAPTKTAPIEIAIELKRLLEFMKLFNKNDIKNKEEVCRLPNNILLNSDVWKSICSNRDLINKGLLALNWTDLQLKTNEQKPVLWVANLLFKFAVQSNVETSTKTKTELNQLCKKPLDRLCKRQVRDYELWKTSSDMAKPTRQAFANYWFLNKQELLRQRGEFVDLSKTYLFNSDENDCLDNWDELTLIVALKEEYLNWCDPQNNTLNRSAT